MSKKPPVIIIGMSRSGTSMITRMLEKLGLFVGRYKSNNSEAKFFLQLNKWLLSQSSGGLENPQSIKYLLNDQETRKLFADFIRFTMKSHRAISYLGLMNYLKYRSPINLDFPWGWKDPRNTYTLPFWLDIFPEAKVIHIYRHGLDIVNSLRTRRRKGLERLSIKHSNFKSLYWYYLMQKFINKDRIFIDLRSSSIEEGLLMWEDYILEARSNLKNLDDRAIEIKFEDLLSEPVTVLKNVTNFCDLESNDTAIEEVSKNIDKDRAYAFLNNPELKESAIQFADRLQTFGY